MSYETIKYEREGGIALVTLNRPESLNAINVKMIGELEQAIDAIAADDEVRAVIVTGGSKVFSVGADVKEILATPENSVPRLIAKGPLPLFEKMTNLTKPTIAAISGPAFGGGCELALVCDLRIASATATFALAEIKLGVIPSAGGTVRLPRLVGSAKAKEMIFFGDPIGAEEAYRIDFVNKIVPAESLEEEAKKWARTLAKRPPLALKAAKSCINVGMQMDLPAAAVFESREAALLIDTEDVAEGLKAFAEKRQPVFKGR